MLKKVVVLFVFLLAIDLVSAANIYGTIYDLNLDKVGKSLITINTNPEQTFVTTNGSYSFYVPEGSYSIKANLIKNNLSVATASHNVQITSEGDFIVDLILFPNFEEELSLIDETDEIAVDELFEESTNLGIYIIIFLILLIILMVFLHLQYMIRKKISYL